MYTGVLLLETRTAIETIDTPEEIKHNEKHVLYLSMLQKVWRISKTFHSDPFERWSSWHGARIYQAVIHWSSESKSARLPNEDGQSGVSMKSSSSISNPFFPQISEVTRKVNFMTRIQKEMLAEVTKGTTDEERLAINATTLKLHLEVGTRIKDLALEHK